MVLGESEQTANSVNVLISSGYDKGTALLKVSCVDDRWSLIAMGVEIIEIEIIKFRCSRGFRIRLRQRHSYLYRLKSRKAGYAARR
jgi:hypothetical protein